jgi:hypothetical protein
MKAAYDEKRWPQRSAQARAVAVRRRSFLPLAKDVEDFAFKDTLINEALIRDLAGGGFSPTAQGRPGRRSRNGQDASGRRDHAKLHPIRIARALLYYRRSHQSA